MGANNGGGHAQVHVMTRGIILQFDQEEGLVFDTIVSLAPSVLTIEILYSRLWSGLALFAGEGRKYCVGSPGRASCHGCTRIHDCR